MDAFHLQSLLAQGLKMRPPGDKDHLLPGLGQEPTIISPHPPGAHNCYFIDSSCTGGSPSDSGQPA